MFQAMLGSDCRLLSMVKAPILQIEAGRFVQGSRGPSNLQIALDRMRFSNAQVVKFVWLYCTR